MLNYKEKVFHKYDAQVFEGLASVQIKLLWNYDLREQLSIIAALSGYAAVSCSVLHAKQIRN